MPSPRTLSLAAGDLRALAREIAPAPSGARERPHWVAPALSAALAVALGAFLATHGSDFVGALHRALHASWSLVVLGALFEAASIAGYIFLLHRVVSAADERLSLRDSYDITLAGTAATRLLPTAGLGGAALTVWALRARGVKPHEIAERLVAFLVLLYAVYMAALLASGIAVGAGLAHVGRGAAIGLAGAAVAGAVTLTVGLGLMAPRGLSAAAERRSTTARIAAHLPVLRRAIIRAAQELRHPHPALLGALAWWAFDIAVLGAMLHAFGAHTNVPALVLAYFLGTLFNVLPLPGSLSGGLAGVLIALGTPAAPALAAVLAYRAVATWLPAAQGIASLHGLRRSVTAWTEAAAPKTA